MMQAQLKDVLSGKGESIQSVAEDTTVLAAVNQMRKQNIGALLIVEDGRVKGIFTERDVLFRVVNDGLNPATTMVSQVMTADPFCVSPAMDVKSALRELTERHIRHLPLIEDGKLVGLVSNGDLSRHLAAQQEDEIRGLIRKVKQEGFNFKSTLLLVVAFIILVIVGVLAS
jgi:CBS domain-containing protein